MSGNVEMLCLHCHVGPTQRNTRQLSQILFLDIFSAFLPMPNIVLAIVSKPLGLLSILETSLRHRPFALSVFSSLVLIIPDCFAPVCIRASISQQFLNNFPVISQQCS